MERAVVKPREQTRDRVKVGRPEDAAAEIERRRRKAQARAAADQAAEHFSEGRIFPRKKQRGE